MVTRFKKHPLLTALTVVVLFLAFGFLWFYVTLFPVAFVDMHLFEPHPAFSKKIEWEPWTATLASPGRPPSQAKSYSSFRKGRHATLFHTFVIVQGKQSSDSGSVEYLPGSTEVYVRKGTLLSVIVLIIALAAVLHSVAVKGIERVKKKSA